MNRYTTMPPYSRTQDPESDWLLTAIVASLLILAMVFGSGCVNWPSNRAKIVDFVGCAANDPAVQAYLEDPGAARDIVEEVQGAAERVAYAYSIGVEPETADLVTLSEGMRLLRVMTRCLPEGAE